MSDEDGGIRSRGEEVIGELAQSLLENPLFSQALGKALGAGERAAGAQRAALNAIDVPSAGDLERLSRRVRALSDRVEALEDELDRLRRDRAPRKPRPNPRLDVQGSASAATAPSASRSSAASSGSSCSGRPSTLRTTSPTAAATPSCRQSDSTAAVCRSTNLRARRIHRRREVRRRGVGDHVDAVDGGAPGARSRRRAPRSGRGRASPPAAGRSADRPGSDSCRPPRRRARRSWRRPSLGPAAAGGAGADPDQAADAELDRPRRGRPPRSARRFRSPGPSAACPSGVSPK